jgi:hypothetical protein
MEQAAAFRACYSDWRLVKTRSVIQIVLEIPVEDSDRAYQVLGGMPAPGAERWCAVARLTEGREGSHVLGEAAGPAQAEPCGEQDRPHKSRKPVDPDKRLSNEAGRMCAEMAFQRFLFESDYTTIVSEESAAAAVRLHCGITSRAELVPGSEGAERWIDIRGRFGAWKIAA